MQASVLRRTAMAIAVLALVALPSPAKAGPPAMCSAQGNLSAGVPAVETFVVPPAGGEELGVVPAITTGPECGIQKSSSLAKVTMEVGGTGVMSGKMYVTHNAGGPYLESTFYSCGPAVNGCTISLVVPNIAFVYCGVQGVAGVFAYVVCTAEDVVT